MKIELDLESRRYIYAVLKMLAHAEVVEPTKLFWAELANRLGPNQTVAHLRRKEVELILDIVGKAVDTINGPIKSKAADTGQQLRAEAVNIIMTKVKAKLEEKLAVTDKEEKNGI